MIAKVMASHDLWSMLIGTINTKEKFEAKRMELAQNQWKKMKASDSRECRNCHSFDGMNTKKQRPTATKESPTYYLRSTRRTTSELAGN